MPSPPASQKPNASLAFTTNRLSVIFKPASTICGSLATAGATLALDAERAAVDAARAELGNYGATESSRAAEQRRLALLKGIAFKAAAAAPIF
jgi:hypothetical protein